MDGAKVLIDSAVLERVDATQPPYLSRTSWVNHLLDCAVTPPHVDQYTIEAVKENVDILKVISEEVELVEEGNERFIGTCPIHKSEQLLVNPPNDYFYCRSCGGGNVIKWEMVTKGVSFTEAVISLADRCDIPIRTVIWSPGDRLKRNLQRSAMSTYSCAGDDGLA